MLDDIDLGWFELSENESAQLLDARMFGLVRWHGMASWKGEPLRVQRLGIPDSKNRKNH